MLARTTLSAKPIQGSSSTRRHNRQKERVADRYFWAVSVRKIDLQEVGWWRSRGELSYYTTRFDIRCSFCVLSKWIPPDAEQWTKPEFVHIVNFQEGNTLRLNIRTPDLYFDKLEQHDPDTLVEYMVDTDELRVWYSPMLRPFQHKFYKGENAIVAAFNRLQRRTYWSDK
jgi:hypothetical protein